MSKGRDWLAYRLHLRSDDFDSSLGLQLVIDGLSRVPFGDLVADLREAS